MLVLLVLAAFVSAGLALLIARGISRAMRQLVDAATGISEGDVEQNVEAAGV